MDQRRRDHRRMSAESYDDFTTHHRYDSNSSLDLAIDSPVAPPRSKMLRRSLSGTSLHSADRDKETTRELMAGDLHTMLSFGGHSRSNLPQSERDHKGHTRSKGHTSSQDMKDTGERVVTEVQVTESFEEHLVPFEGHSRSCVGCSTKAKDMAQRCVKCGCESQITYSTSPINVKDAELGHLSQGKVGTGCGGENADPLQGKESAQSRRSRPSRIDEIQGMVGGKNDSFQGRGSTQSRCGGNGLLAVESYNIVEASRENFQGKASTQPRCGGPTVESYTGELSRQLYDQFVRLLADLDTERQTSRQVYNSR